MPAPPIPPDLLNADHLRAVLDACGYRTTSVLLGGTRHLPAGCRLSLQFGDLIATAPDGVTCLTIRCSVVINGGEEFVNGVGCWQMRKVFRTFVGGDRLDLAIEADLLLGHPVPIEDASARCDQIDGYLRRLVSDLRSTLQELPVDDGGTPVADAPVLRLEARFAGDVATGRSGIVRPRIPGSRRFSAAAPRISTQHRQITTAACDCLADDVISELTRAMHGATPQRVGRYPSQQDAVSEQSLHPVSAARAQPPGPLHRTAATASEPLQSSTSIH